MDDLAKAPIGLKDPGSVQFPDIQTAEIERINLRRRHFGRSEVRAIRANPTAAAAVYDTVGLALSGGGIRSAAFSLGVLQALDHHGVLRNTDYLSTVSGGGYIGSSLTATLTASKGEFVFRGEKNKPGGAPLTSELSDTEAVGHIRNYSNYLIPAGARDLLTGAAIVVRGLVANAALVFPVVLLLAALTIWSNPNRSSLLQPDLFGFPLQQYIPVENFGITLVLALVGLGLFFLWALYRSFLPSDKLSEFRTRFPSWAAGYLVVLAISFFCEAQTFVVAGMFDIADGGGFFSYLTGLIKALAAITTPIAAIVMFFRQQLGALFKSASTTSSLSTKALAVAGKAAVWLAGLALPLLIWVAYLYLCYWGIINDFAGAAGGEHTPYWLLKASESVSRAFFGYVIERPMAFLYVSVGLLSLALSWLLRPNANSLHRLYRDRLSKAFLFDPGTYSEPGLVGRNKASIDQKRDFEPLDTMRLSELSPVHAPLHLVNAALNIQGSDYANRRGRNADFFLMSPLHVGSFATGYAPTADLEKAATDLDLATAMAISGAAASSNMGAKSIKPLTATLALLNIRLGYWLKNPRYAGENASASGRAWAAGPARKPSQFLWAEITGRLYENSDEIYLTDGGHIENLGVYELLRRRCRVIVCVDVEADPEMRFGAFITLQRYARIDLGVRIEMPWDVIRSTTLSAMGSGREGGATAKPLRGAHAAIGTIDYGGGATGFLVYIKASLTGDENDYIRDYGRRFGRFPHESTGDQFFSEEQFEVYRALAFHAVHGLMNGNDVVEVAGSAEPVNFKSAENKTVKAVRDALI